MHLHNQKTPFANTANVDRSWHLLDADNQVLGRLATRAATLLRGKHKATYSPSADHGDFVVIINAAKVRLTGKKLEQKEYHRYSGYLGGLKSVTAGRQLVEKPEEAFIHAVRGMLPRGPLGRKMLKKLKVYASETHPHQAQLTKKDD